MSESLDSLALSDIATADGAGRRAASAQTPCVIWLTGPFGAGDAGAAATAIARRVERHLAALGRRTVRLDGDPVLTAETRAEALRRAGDVAKLLHESGLTVIAALGWPLRADRAQVAARLPRGRFVEVHLDAPADAGYEPPLSPALSLRADRMTADAAAEHIVQAVIGCEWRPA